MGAQPYGLLPATVLARWRPDPLDPVVEEGLIPRLITLRTRYRDAATARGNVVGASEDLLLDLVGQLPTSRFFRHRLAWPLELWWLAFDLVGADRAWSAVDQDWHQHYALATELGLTPARRYGARSAAGRVQLPLVVPATLPAGWDVVTALKRLIDVAGQAPAQFADVRILEAELLNFAPDSLLLRLVIRSLQVAIGDVGREKARQERPLPEPVVRDASEPGRLEAWIRSVTDTDLRSGTPAAQRFQGVLDGVINLTAIEPVRLERLLAAAVDTAAFRVDPWLIAPPTRRLDALLDAGEAVPRLGAYGWVDAPRPGTPGPTAAGLLHAPSQAQALTAAVLRDRAVSDPAATRWHLDLTSASVRDADRLAEHVRIGAHLAEAVGREVERVVARLADVHRLRATYPLRTEHEGRRVCDGLAVLAAPPADLGLARRAGRVGPAAGRHRRLRRPVGGRGRPPRHRGPSRRRRRGDGCRRRDFAPPGAGLAAHHAPGPGPRHERRAGPDGGGRAAGTRRRRGGVRGEPLDAGRRRRRRLHRGPVGRTGDVDLRDRHHRRRRTARRAAHDGEPRRSRSGADGRARADDHRPHPHRGERRRRRPGGRARARPCSTGGTGVVRYERARRLVALVGRRPGTPDALTEQADPGVNHRPARRRFAGATTSSTAPLSPWRPRLGSATDPADRTPLSRLAREVGGGTGGTGGHGAR